MAEDIKPNDPTGTPPSVNPADNNGSKVTPDQHWQKIANDRFNENEQLKKDLEELKKNNSVNSEVETLRSEIEQLKTDKERQKLEAEYPDIEPDLLLGKTPDERKNIADRQRERTKKHYEQSIDVNPPQYTASEYADQVQAVQQSNKTPLEKAQAILRLGRQQRESS